MGKPQLRWLASSFVCWYSIYDDIALGSLCLVLGDDY